LYSFETAFVLTITALNTFSNVNAGLLGSFKVTCRFNPRIHNKAQVSRIDVTISKNRFLC
jgi:hypothetical protein